MIERLLVVTSVKYFGVKLDEHSKFTGHVTEVVNKCVGRLGFLFRNSFLDFECRKILCGSLIQPYLDYCCSAWYSGLPKLLKNRLNVFQRRMVKFVFSKDMFYHVTPADLSSLS